MKQPSRLNYIIILCFFCSSILAQSSFVFPQGFKKRAFTFELINNLIVVPVKINGQPFNFLLDSGVQKTILFNNDLISVLKLKNKTTVNLRGFSDSGPIKAYKVQADIFELDKLKSFNHDILLLAEENLKFSQRMGFQIDGILGSSLFKDFKITVNYITQRLRIEPSSLEPEIEDCKRCITLPIIFRNSKPLVEATIVQNNDKPITGFFLIDSGSSDALWLFDHNINVEKPDSKFLFSDFLGTGINGDIFGDRGKVKKIQLGDFSLDQVKVAFPDSIGYSKVTVSGNRVGSIGGELLSRFKIVFDYPNRQITFKRTSKSFTPFYYNLSGIELQYNGESLVKEKITGLQSPDMHERDGQSQNSGIKIYLAQVYRLRFAPIIEIANLRENSPAAISGVKKGDIISRINGKGITDLTLREIIQKLQKRPGAKVKLEVIRDDVKLTFKFVLEPLL